MTDQNDDGRPWGICGAFGCPLLGSYTSSILGTDRWYCCCHFEKPPGSNDAISQILRSDEFAAIAKTVTDIRENHESFYENPHGYRMIQERLTRMGRTDLLLGAADASPHSAQRPLVKNWLGRLERILINATYNISRKGDIVSSPAKVIGPTHISGYVASMD